MLISANSKSNVVDSIATEILGTDWLTQCPQMARASNCFATYVSYTSIPGRIDHRLRYRVGIYRNRNRFDRATISIC